jgi:hypothetical protein
MRLDLTAERTWHYSRLEKLLEDALIKVTSVASRIDTISRSPRWNGWTGRYNYRRIHTSIDNVSPAEYEKSCYMRGICYSKSRAI